jgi:hypothetical protein
MHCIAHRDQVVGVAYIHGFQLTQAFLDMLDVDRQVPLRAAAVTRSLAAQADLVDLGVTLDYLVGPAKFNLLAS